MPAQRRNVGFVFQHYAAFKHLSVYRNVAFGLEIRKRPKDEIRQRVHELLELVHLEQFADRLPAQLSGGQRQRMALARALAVEPSVLLLDEPFGALDAKVRRELRDWLRRLHDEVHVTTVFVTHDQEEALEVSDEIVVINHGRIEQVGTPADLYDKPANDFVMEFLGPVTRLGGRLVRPHDIEMFTDAGRRRGAGGGHPAAADRLRGAGRTAGRRRAAVGPADPRPGRVAGTRRGFARVGPRSRLRCLAKMPECRSRQSRTMRSARCCNLAAHEPELVKVDVIVREQGLPRKFVEAILGELRRASIVRSQRGADGGYALARPAERDHARRGDPRRRRAAGRGARAAPARDHLRRRRRSICPRCGSRCASACAGCWTRPRSRRCSAASCPRPSGGWSTNRTPGCRAELVGPRPSGLR